LGIKLLQASQEEHMQYRCRTCGSTESEAIADARTLGLKRQLQSGLYNCCQITAWADEQWLAWLEAAEEDGKSGDAITQPLECGDTEVVAPIATQRTRNRGVWDS
jgi:hypothetical protein